LVAAGLARRGPVVDVLVGDAVVAQARIAGRGGRQGVGACAFMLDGWVAFTPAGRYKLSGSIAGGFWYGIGLCRFEVGELDPYLPHLCLVPVDQPLYDL